MNDKSLRAPDRVETALLEAFRRHHRARHRVNMIRRGIVAAVLTGAAAACVIAFVDIPKPVGPPAAFVIHPAPPPIAPVKATAPVSAAPIHKPTHKPRTDRLATAITDFVALPYGDDSLVDESAMIVRVELPRSALRLAGFNVAQEWADQRVQADVVLGADGLAHAVRFVKYIE